MNKMKLIFQQTLMISSGILFGLGIQAMIRYFAEGQEYFTWQWYIPLTVVLTGFLTSLPSLIYLSDEKKEGKQTGKVILHFLAVGAMVSLAAYLFDWYETIYEYLIILLMYVLIYNFVWIGTMWIRKSDDRKINEALADIRDEE